MEGHYHKRHHVGTNDNYQIVKRDLKRILCASSISILILFGVMVFSPLASQIDDDGLSRGTGNEWELDSLVNVKEYQIALSLLDSIITEKKHDLPRFAFFDRFLSEKKRYDVGVLRAEIYDLQWKRIKILQATNDEVALKAASEDYCGIIGYNKERAKSLLIQINEK